MMSLFKELLSTIKHNLKRYISIVIIIFLGGAFYVGMMSNSLVFQRTMDEYLSKYKYPDIKIYSDIGFTKKDINKLKKNVSNIELIEGKYYTEAVTNMKNSNGKKTDYVVFVHSYSSKYKLNKLDVVEGRKIKSKGECVLSINFKDSNIKLGDKVVLNTGDLKQTKYKVVGFVNDPQYIAHDKGISILTGEMVRYFAYVDVRDFEKTDDVYVTADIKLKYKDRAFTKNYDDYANKNQKKIKKELDKILKVRYKKILAQKKQELEDAEKRYSEQKNNIENELSNAQKEITNAETQLRNARLALMPQNKINDYLSTFKDTVDGASTQLENLKKVTEISTKMVTAVEFVRQSGLLTEEQLNKAYYDLTADIYTSEDNHKGYLPKIVEKVQDNYKFAIELDNLIHEKFVCDDIVDDEVKAACEGAKSNLSGKSARLKTVSDDLVEKTNSLYSRIEAAQTYDGLLSVLHEYLDAVNGYNSVAQETYDTALNEYNNLYDQLINKNAELRRKISTTENSLKDAKSNYESKEKEVHENLEKTYNEIIEGKKAVQKGFSYTSIVNTRSDSYGYGNYYEDTKRINNLAKIFPLLFFIVAFLVTSTSITRLVQEERSKIGILKSIGVNKYQIVLKYAIYALSANLIGIILGILFGIFIFPLLTTDVYTLSFYVPKLKYVTSVLIIGVAIILSLISTVLTAVLVTLNVVREVPAKLMRKKEVKKSRLIKIERKSKWFKKLSLVKKIAYRNIFTNVIRSIMTIVGIVGCTALIIASFCVRESLSSYIAIQFNKIYDIDTEFYYKPDVTQYEITSDYKKIKKLKTVKNASLGRKEAVTIDKDNNIKTYSVVPSTLNNFEEDIGLYSTATKKRISLQGQTGVVITEKLAKLLKIKRGDTISFTDASNVHHHAIVSDIVENYVHNYIYMNKNTYEDLYDYKLINNYLIVKYTSDANREVEDSSIYESGKYASYTSMNMYKTSNTNMVKRIDKIIIIIIIAAGLLAFVVLYNISKISISEKTVEISTLKVLGYKAKWINKYINYEIYILKYFGIILGIFAGYFLTEAIITACETNYMMFYHGISILNYIYGIILTLIFSKVISVIIKSDIKKVDMAKSLKVTEE